ncbi:hypothetical protein D3C72_2297190 [compost metagenome]
MPGSWISTGSSAVEILMSPWFSRFRKVYSDTVLPLPVGPVTSTMPYGRLITSSSSAFCCGS